MSACCLEPLWLSRLRSLGSPQISPELYVQNIHTRWPRDKKVGERVDSSCLIS